MKVIQIHKPPSRKQIRYFPIDAPIASLERLCSLTHFFFSSDGTGALAQVTVPDYYLSTDFRNTVYQCCGSGIVNPESRISDPGSDNKKA
jgi:hypothetical protein